MYTWSNDVREATAWTNWQLALWLNPRGGGGKNMTKYHVGEKNDWKGKNMNFKFNIHPCLSIQDTTAKTSVQPKSTPSATSTPAEHKRKPDLPRGDLKKEKNTFYSQIYFYVILDLITCIELNLFWPTTKNMFFTVLEKNRFC